MTSSNVQKMTGLGVGAGCRQDCAVGRKRNPAPMARSKTKASAGFCQSPVPFSITKTPRSGHRDEQTANAGIRHYL
jgi:hypothetical protein